MRDYRQRQAAALGVIIASYMLILLDTSIVITGLPYIRADVGLTPAELSWAQSIYTLFFGGFLLLGARAGDIYGARKALLTGLSIFMVTSLAIAMAATPLWLLAARAGQGIGAAFIAPSALTLLSANFPEGEERTKALSWYASTAGIGATVGLIVGGVLADLLSWRLGFLLNVPVGLLIFVAARKNVTETPQLPHKLDVVGAVFSTFGIGSMIYGVMQAAEAGSTSETTILPVLAGAAVTAVFLWHESRTEYPLLPLQVFKHRRRAGAYIVRFLFLGPMVGFFFFSSQFMQGVLGYSALKAGLGFFPMTLAGFGFALLVPRLAKHFKQTTLLLVGLASVSLGLFWLSCAGVTANYWVALALPMVLIGAGQGLSLPPMTAAGIADTGPQDGGAASGMVNVSHQMGASFGLGLLSSLAAISEEGVSGGVVKLATGCHTAFLSGAILMAVAATLALLLIVPGMPERTRDTQSPVRTP